MRRDGRRFVTPRRPSRRVAGPAGAALFEIALASVLVALAAPGCGARTGIDEPRAAPPPDRPDAGAACGPSLRAAGAPLRPFGETRAEGPRVVARAEGYDVTALAIEDVIEYRARRVEVRDGVAVLGATGVLGPDARSVAALAARGRTLAFCYGAVDLEGPTRWVRTDDLDYATLVRSTLGEDGGDHCVALAAGPDRWLAGWQDRGGGRLDWAVAEVDDDGQLRGAVHSLVGPPLAATRRPAGFAWAGLDEADRSRARVTFDDDDGTTRELELALTDGTFLDRLAIEAAAPPAALDLDVAWIDGRGALGTLVLGPDGAERSHTLDAARPEIQDGPVLAVLGSRTLVGVTGCDRGIDGPGRLEILARTGSRLDALVVLDRPACPTRPAIASVGSTALVAWQEAERTLLLLVSCDR